MSNLTPDQVLKMSTPIAELPGNLLVPPGRYALEYNGYSAKDTTGDKMLFIMNFRILQVLEVNDQAQTSWERASKKTLVGSDYEELFFRNEEWAELWAGNIATFGRALGAEFIEKATPLTVMDSVKPGTRFEARIMNSTTKKGRDIDSIDPKSISLTA